MAIEEIVMHKTSDGKVFDNFWKASRHEDFETLKAMLEDYARKTPDTSKVVSELLFDFLLKNKTEIIYYLAQISDTAIREHYFPDESKDVKWSLAEEVPI